MATGTCLLTGEIGKLVNAHIIPKALTYPDTPGMPFAQAGRDVPPKRRHSSWYDPTIVTRAGEDILSEIDNSGIAELRRHRLVWSSWNGADRLGGEDHRALPIAGWGARVLEGVDGQCLRLFFVSLLWRAAVSQLDEFAEVSLRASELRRLRRMLLKRDPSPSHIFPLSLVQISTRGACHNMTPVAQRKPCDPTRPSAGAIPIIRFYMDGLIAHVHVRSNPSEVEELGPLFVGGEKLTISTVEYDRSWERENMEELVREASERWPERLARIPGFQ